MPRFPTASSCSNPEQAPSRRGKGLMKTVVLSRLERLQKSFRGFRISNDKELRGGVPPLVNGGTPNQRWRPPGQNRGVLGGRPSPSSREGPRQAIRGPPKGRCQWIEEEMRINRWEDSSETEYPPPALNGYSDSRKRRTSALEGRGTDSYKRSLAPRQEAAAIHALMPCPAEIRAFKRNCINALSENSNAFSLTLLNT